MPDTCSSSELNGCSPCGPSIHLWALSHSSSISPVGHAAYDGSGKTYMSESISSSSKTSFKYNGEIWFLNYPPPPFEGFEIIKKPVQGSSSSSSSGSSSTTYVYKIDDYGDLIIWADTSTSGNSNSSSGGSDYDLCYPDGQGFSSNSSNSSAGGASTSKGSLGRCGQVNMSTNTNCSSKSSGTSSITSSTGNPNCGTTSYSNNGFDCGFPSFAVNDPNPTATKKTESSENNSSGGCDPGGPFIRNGNCQDTSVVKKEANLGGELSKSVLFSYSQQIVNKKIEIFETNEDQNCDGLKCGGEEGGEDDCWFGIGGFYLNGNNLNNPNSQTSNFQRLKFKAGVSIEEFKKDYTNLSGKVIYYYDGEGKTPCCNADFNGTIFKEFSYSISSGGDTFKDEFYAMDLGEISNQSQSEGLGLDVCITIDKVTFS